MASVSDLRKQLERLRASGLAGKLIEQATAHGLPPALLFAIASRETNCTNELGDVQASEAHGVGILQIDIQHPCARQARDSGSWRTNPDPLIAMGAQLLAENLRQARRAFPALSVEQQWKIAASGYNCGMGASIAGARAGDSDRHTTGGDYGADVMERMKLFAELMAESEAAVATA